MMKRRDALKAIGGIAGAATLGKALPGCGGDDGPVGITTIVVLMMENRSYDHLLGARALEGLPGDGLTASMSNPDRQGNPVTVHPAGPGDDSCDLDPPHGWTASREQVNGGAMDGFLRVHQAEHEDDLLVDPMSYLTRDHQPTTWSLADHYVSCDRWHASVLGPTWPNRMYWHSATSMGIQSNDMPDGGFDWTSIYHRLLEAGIDYRYYYGDLPVIAIIEDLEGNRERIKTFDKFFLDAADGLLPPVVYIDPSFSANDDHPPHHPLLGQQLIASIYTALANSPQWKNILFVVTYDEHGGYYDHVAPPADAPDEFAAMGFDQRGVRVPGIVVGPYVKEGAVVSTLLDHTSVLRHIENMFGLEPMYLRDAGANDLTDCLDAERLARGAWRPPVEIAPVELNESDITDACKYSSFKGDLAHPMLTWRARYPKLFAGYERPSDRDYLFTIGDYLDRHNMGRIRRGR